MRLLANLEVYTSTDLSGVSIFNDLQAMLEAAQSMQPTFAEWVVPVRPAGITWPEGYFEKPWIGLQPTGYAMTPPFDHPPVGPDELVPLLPRRGRVIFDYVLNQRFLHSAAIANAFFVPYHRYFVRLHVPVITWYTETSLDPRLPTLKNQFGHALTASIGLQGSTIVMNEYDKVELERIWSLYLMPNVVAAALERTHVVNPTADFTRIEARRPEYEARRKARREATGMVALFHGGSLEKKRRLWTAAHAAWALQMAGFPISATFATQHNPTVSPYDALDTLMFKKVGHAQYLDLLAEGDIAFVGAEYEGTGLGYMEAIWSGQLPVVFSADWMLPRIPPEYPFVVRNEWDLYACLQHLSENYDEEKAKWWPALQEALNAYSPASAAGQFLEATEKVMTPEREYNLELVTHIQPAYGILLEAIETHRWPEIVDPLPVWAAMTEISREKVQFSSWVPPLVLRWMLMTAGYSDRCDRSGLSMQKEW